MNARVSSSAGSKKIYLYPSVSPDETRRRIPDIQFDLPCVVRRTLGGEKTRRRWVSVFVLLLFFASRRVTVTHSHPVLATGPCWHSFSQRHVTASLHNSEARVLFRDPDWPSPAEARPKWSAPIGCRSINSDCHVSMEESH